MARSSTVKSQDIRTRYLRYFEGQGHRVVASSPLVPQNDPTLFFTNAGLVQFKDVFLGADQRDYRRAATVQKCLRVSGKHNDLENVGRTPRHHTFFEMLGNFSFGDYFKREAIPMAWQLLTGDLGIDPKRLWITVFEEDDEALDLWASTPGVDRARIQRLGAKDNFWAMGDTGPCGPCSEIHYDHGAEYGGDGGPATESPRYVEIWNLVFMQFDRSADGALTPLPKPSIDTGMGLERLAAVLQGKYSNYDTDCFGPILDRAAELAGLRYGAGGEADVALRVIADHARAAAFLVADGVMPSNEERGYVLRRIMRRAIRFGVKVGMNEPFLWRAAEAVIGHMGAAYPELMDRASFVTEVIRGEEERFSETLDRGLTLLERELAAVNGPEGSKVLGGDVAFKLQDTFGFPIDLTRLIASERDVSVDEASYTQHLEAQRAASRESWRGSGEQAVSEVFHAIQSSGVRTQFTGYALDDDDATVLALVRDGSQVDGLMEGQRGFLITSRTPFYAESGGQVGDTGSARSQSSRLHIEDAQRPVDGLVAHRVLVTEGFVRVGDRISLAVDSARRDRTRLNHTATHLLHAALRTVLGEHVAQKGSMVTPDRLRFDFAHHKAMSADELERVEDLVYGQILRNDVVSTEEHGIEDARKLGAMALFGEKYGDRVRVVAVPGFSIELCGGTHARRTGDIGLFRVTSEAGVAAGVRRVEAVTGPGALAYVRARDAAAREAASQLRTSPEALPEALQRVLDDRKRMDKEIESLRRQLATAQAGDITSAVREIGGIKVLAAELSGDAATLREEADRLRDTLGTAVVVLAARDAEGVKLVATASKDIAGKKVHAGKLVQKLATALGGGGGGRPDMAQAGGKHAAALPEALESVYAYVAAATA